MSVAEKITSTEWEMLDTDSIIIYKKKFYSAKNDQELLVATVEFLRPDIKWLEHSFTDIDSVKRFKLKPFEARTLLNAIEEFVKENYFKIYDPKISPSEVVSKIWEVNIERTHDVYTKDFYLHNSNTVLFRVKVLFGKFEPNFLHYVSTIILNPVIFRFKPSTAQKFLDTAEKFVKEVLYKYYEPML